MMNNVKLELFKLNTQGIT